MILLSDSCSFRARVQHISLKRLCARAGEEADAARGDGVTMPLPDGALVSRRETNGRRVAPRRSARLRATGLRRASGVRPGGPLDHGQVLRRLLVAPRRPLLLVRRLLPVRLAAGLQRAGRQEGVGVGNAERPVRRRVEINRDVASMASGAQSLFQTGSSRCANSPVPRRGRSLERGRPE